MPTLGIPQLCGYLHEKKIECKAYDISIDFLRDIRSKKIFDAYFKNSNCFGCNEKLNKLNDFKSYLQRQIFGQNISLPEELYSQTISCLNFLSHCDETYQISTDDLKSSYSWWNKTDIVQAVNGNSVFHDIFISLPSVKEIVQLQSNYIGFSISYESQMLPALILAQIFKDKINDVKIIFGGSFFYTYEKKFYEVFFETDYVDILSVGPGERILEFIAKRGLTIHAGDQKKFQFKAKQILNKFLFNSNEIVQTFKSCSPHFKDINFSNYFSYEKAFPYMIKDRCYYKKCKFCNGDQNSTFLFPKSIKNAITDVNRISKKNDIKNIYFVDAALSPSDCKYISQHPKQINFSWIANARFEKNFTDKSLIHNLSKSGCAMLRFGLESGSQKVLDKMNKGISISDVEKILKITSEAGISNHLYIMFGYPCETKKDRELTINLLTKHRFHFYSYSISFFQPMPNTPIYEELVKQASKKGFSENNLLQYVYNSEEEYKDMCKDVLRLNKQLENHVHTNIIYYSANLFSGLNNIGNQFIGNQVSIESEMFLFTDNNFNLFKNTPKFLIEVKIIQKNLSPNEANTFIIFDLKKNSKLFIQTHEVIVNVFQKNYTGDLNVLISKIDDQFRKKVIALFHLISNFSNCITLSGNKINISSHDYFTIETSISHELKDMAIQFYSMESKS